MTCRRHETTSSAFTWACYLLAKHQDLQQKLRDEVCEAFKDQEVNGQSTDLGSLLEPLPYLNGVMNETLRLYPAVPFNMRLALHDTTLPHGGGPDGSLPLAVLKDTPVGYSTLLMQRRDDLYPPIGPDFPDPQRFAPERWSVWQPRPWLYIPFNGGPRICIGQQFALTQMSLTLFRVFQNFESIEARDQGPLRIRASTTGTLFDGCLVSLTPA